MPGNGTKPVPAPIRNYSRAFWEGQGEQRVSTWAYRRQTAVVGAANLTLVSPLFDIQTEYGGAISPVRGASKAVRIFADHFVVHVHWNRNAYAVAPAVTDPTLLVVETVSAEESFNLPTTAHFPQCGPGPFDLTGALNALLGASFVIEPGVRFIRFRVTGGFAAAGTDTAAPAPAAGVPAVLYLEVTGRQRSPYFSFEAARDVAALRERSELWTPGLPLGPELARMFSNA